MSVQVYRWVRNESRRPVGGWENADPNDTYYGDFSQPLISRGCKGAAWNYLEERLRREGPPPTGTRYCIYDGFEIIWADDPVKGLNQARTVEDPGLDELLDLMEEEERNGRAAAQS